MLKNKILGILPIHNGGIKMSKVVILKIDTLSHVFTTLESGSKCQFQYELINNDKISNVIQPLVVNDAVLCVFDDVVKIALRVVSKTFDKVTLTKEIELNEGFQIKDETILRVLNDTQIYECNVDFKQNLYESLTGNFNSTLRQLFEIDVTEEKEINSGNTHTKQQSAITFTPTQIIYYGVPGAGKSHTIKNKLEHVPDFNKIRTVFHPEYSNADFVGQILPCVGVDTSGKSVVEYVFKPGPFTEIIRRAYLNPGEEFFLVVEEINRGNAAAIFGDAFQLLDRLDSGETDSSNENEYGEGWSSYGIDNVDINAYIRNRQALISDKNSENNKHGINAEGSGEDTNPKYYRTVNVKTGNAELHISANTAIRLPPNLSILATMNTSDQNVFTLDNAFQRRFKMELVPNEFGVSEEERIQRDASIGRCSQKWDDFRKDVNTQISTAASSMEDKRLGPWFIKANITDGKGEINASDFADKVIKYLWDDAFKHDSDKKGKFGFNSFEEVRKAFIDSVEKGEKENGLGTLFDNFNFSKQPCEDSPETPVEKQSETPATEQPSTPGT